MDPDDRAAAAAQAVNRLEQRNENWARLRRRSWIAFLTVVLLVIGGAMALLIVRQDQARDASTAEEAQILSLLHYVASVQNGPQAKAARDATSWYVAEMQAICAATPRCVQPPLPAALGGP